MVIDELLNNLIESDLLENYEIKSPVIFTFKLKDVKNAEYQIHLKYSTSWFNKNINKKEYITELIILKKKGIIYLINNRGNAG